LKRIKGMCVSNYCNDKTAAFYANMLVTVKIRYTSKSVRLQGKGNLISLLYFLLRYYAICHYIICIRLFLC